MIPDLAVEVVSPTNTAIEIEGKVVKYPTAGVRLDWVVHLATGRIYIHESLSTTRVVNRDSKLDGGVVLPEFRLPLSQLIEPE